LKRSSYYQHIGIYGFQSAVLRQITRLTPGRAEQAESLEQLRWMAHGFRIMLAETTTASIAIDTPDDLLRITNKP
jgi:3-deoxy-manno-octulosonate cytidylyltransferase (CMP-KDO synthetase)